MEEARTKAEYEKIMDVDHEDLEKGIHVYIQSSSSPLSSCDEASFNASSTRKRQIEETDNTVEKGMRVKSKFDGRDWCGGSVTRVMRDKGGNVITKVEILYDDGDEEERDWPDINIVVVHGQENKSVNKDKKRRKDEENLKMFICEEGGCRGCKYQSKWKGQLKKHKAFIHDIDVVYHFCTENGCDYVAKQPGQLKSHKASVHGVGVVYFPCSTNGCEYKSNRRDHLRSHQANIHDINVVYYPCNEE